MASVHAFRKNLFVLFARQEGRNTLQHVTWKEINIGLLKGAKYACAVSAKQTQAVKGSRSRLGDRMRVANSCGGDGRVQHSSPSDLKGVFADSVI